MPTRKSFPIAVCRLLPSGHADQQLAVSGTDMQTFGKIISEARKNAGLSQKDLALKIKKEDGEPISPQYLNDIEHDRRNPPGEFLIEQFARVLGLDKDYLCLAAGTIPQQEKRAIASTDPDKVVAAFRVFRKKIRKG